MHDSFLEALARPEPVPGGGAAAAHGACVGLALLEKIVLVEQFRFPAYEKGDGWMIEVVAGILGKGEKPEEAVRREVLEETGYRVCELTHISSFYLSPGGSSERIFLYYAEVNDSDKVAGGGGVETEHEDIRILEYSLPEIWRAWQAGEIKDAKTIIALMWFRSNKFKDTNSWCRVNF